MNATATPMSERVAALYCAARDLIRDEVSAARVLRLPDVTAAGLDAVGAVIRARPDLAVAVGRVLDRAAGIPASSRRRRVLTAVARWLPGTPGHLKGGEQWFSGRVVRDVAEASAGTVTHAEAAGWVALNALASRGE
ncbi:MAG: hypothetical protein C0467_17575 [Planctomycetaceae bacterium]|nr:hypothetical protein [Planctomycetaceae bacterium]